MIKNLLLKNFQSHIDSKIEFDSGFNVICGSSDSGKSALLRALMWVIANRPSGDSIKNWNTDEKTVVEIDLDKGTIKKERDNKTIYIVNDTKLEAVKTDVPLEISDIINFSEFNFQSQHQPYFLLNDSPGEVAKKLNELVGLSIIDRIFKNLSSKATETKRIAEEEKQKVDSLSFTINSLSYLDKAEKDIEEIDVLSSAIEEKEKKARKIEKVIIDFISLLEKKASYSLLVSLDSSVKSLLKEVFEFKEKETNYLQLLSTVSSIVSISNEILLDNDWLEVEKEKEQLSSLVIQFSAKKASLKQIEKILSSLKGNRTSLVKEENTLKGLRFSHLELIKKVKVCPFCNTKITESKIKEMTK